MRRRICTVALVAALTVGSSVLAGVGGATAAQAGVPPQARVAQHTSSPVVTRSAEQRDVGLHNATNAIGNQLASGRAMNGPTEYLVSSSGQFEIAADGLIGPEVGLYWNSYSSGSQGISVDPFGGSTHVLAMQTDGNLVLYTNGGTVTWASNTEGNPGAVAVLQNDGNFVVYSTAGRALWGSATFPTEMWSYDVEGDVGTTFLDPGWFLTRNGYTLVQQADGNLVLYAPTGRAVWASNTNGNPRSVTVLQPDGNLVVYSENGVALWGNGRARAGGVFVLALQPDGNLVQYWDPFTVTPGFRPIWATQTAGLR